jgi:hypothetical protein
MYTSDVGQLRISFEILHTQSIVPDDGVGCQLLNLHTSRFAPGHGGLVRLGRGLDASVAGDHRGVLDAPRRTRYGGMSRQPCGMALETTREKSW